MSDIAFSIGTKANRGNIFENIAVGLCLLFILQLECSENAMKINQNEKVEK